MCIDQTIAATKTLSGLGCPAGRFALSPKQGQLEVRRINKIRPAMAPKQPGLGIIDIAVSQMQTDGTASCLAQAYSFLLLLFT